MEWTLGRKKKDNNWIRMTDLEERNACADTLATCGMYICSTTNQLPLNTKMGLGYVLTYLCSTPLCHHFVIYYSSHSHYKFHANLVITHHYLWLPMFFRKILVRLTFSITMILNYCSMKINWHINLIKIHYVLVRYKYNLESLKMIVVLNIVRLIE